MKQGSSRHPDGGRPEQAEVRVDKWLQVARIFKTRTQAGEAIDAGHVKLDGARVKAGHIVKPGETLEVVKGPRRLWLTVKAVAERPLPPAEARELYEVREEVERMDNLTEEQRETVRMMQLMDRAAQASRKGQGRPTKKDRRDMGRP
jgi:ribosome-associated heat shock protein Hsp15